LQVQSHKFKHQFHPKKKKKKPKTKLKAATLL
jgi:hypothetical protein